MISKTTTGGAHVTSSERRMAETTVSEASDAQLGRPKPFTETASRSVPEWIGATPNSKVPDRVAVRVFLKYNGRCHWSGLPIRTGDHWDVDHIKAIINGGENRESNLAPILRGKPHKEKTAEDVKIKSKTARMRAKHLGLHKSKGPKIRSRGFQNSART